MQAFSGDITSIILYGKRCINANKRYITLSNGFQFSRICKYQKLIWRKCFQRISIIMRASLYQ